MTSRRVWTSRLVSLLFVGAMSMQAADAVPLLAVSATPSPALVGSSVGLDVVILGIADLYTYQFSLAFDPAVLQATGASVGTFLGTGGSTFVDVGTIDNALGTISFAFGSLIGSIPGVSGGGILEHITFSATHVGTSALTLGDVLFLDSSFADLTPQVASGSLSVVGTTPVPEPEAFALLGLGLAAMAAWRRRKTA